MNKLKIYLLLFFPLILSCTQSSNEQDPSKIGILENGTGEVIEKQNNELKSEFDQIKLLYDSGNYDEVDKKIKKIVKDYSGNSFLEDFLNNSQIGKEYKTKSYGKDNLGKEFVEIRDLFDEGEVEESFKRIDALVSKYGREHTGIKDFLENSDLGKIYETYRDKK